MDNMSVADYLAIADRNGSDGVWGGNSGFLWVILIFLFFLGFSGGGLFGPRSEVSSDLAQTQRDILQTAAQTQNQILSTSCNTEKVSLENRYDTLLGFKDQAAQIASCCCENRLAIANQTNDLTAAIHAEGEATRALITANTIQELRDNLQAAQLTLGNVSQTQNILSALGRYVANPCTPYNFTTGYYPYGYGTTVTSY